MRQELAVFRQWTRPYAVACVVKTWGSAPRPVGSLMGVRDDGLIVGSVSGGCVEADVVRAAHEVVKYGGLRTLHFASISEEAVWQAGLSCGGEIEVVVWRPDGEPAWQRLLNEEVGSYVLDLSTSHGSFIEDTNLASQPGRMVLSMRPTEQLLIFGAVHIAIPLVSFARALGFRTVVIDPRSAFAKTERFTEPPDELLALWPDEAFANVPVTSETYAVMLSHEPRIDTEALRRLLRSPARYLGALGSRKTQEARKMELLSEGFSEEEIGRIQGPVGLNIGAVTPEEIALSIAAQLVEARRLR